MSIPFKSSKLTKNMIKVPLYYFSGENLEHSFEFQPQRALIGKKALPGASFSQHNKHRNGCKDSPFKVREMKTINPKSILTYLKTYLSETGQGRSNFEQTMLIVIPIHCSKRRFIT